MTNEEIIRELEVLKEFFIEQSGSAYPVCLEYAIEKLSEKCDDCQEFDCSRCDREDDLISRQAAIDEIKDVYKWHDVVTEDRLIQHMKNLPSAQPEIIRCKDCKYEDNCDETLGCPWCFAWGDTTEHDAYCSYAKRRENG